MRLSWDVGLKNPYLYYFFIHNEDMTVKFMCYVLGISTGKIKQTATTSKIVFLSKQLTQPKIV